MSDQSETSQPTQQKKPAGTVGRPQLEAALKQALASGPSALPQQIRYVLALCQLGGAKPTTTAIPESPLTVAEARLTALVHIADSLNSVERRSLMREIEKIGEDDVRLRLKLALIPHMAPEITLNQLQDLYREALKIENVDMRSRLFIELARTVPAVSVDKHEIAGTLADTVTIAQNITNTETRVRSLVALAPHLPVNMADGILKNILDEIDRVANDSLRANTVSAMAENLSEQTIRRAFKSAQLIDDPSERTRALIALSRQSTPGLVSEIQATALKAIANIRNEDERSSMMVTFSPYLDSASVEEGFPVLLEQALGIAISLTKRLNRANVFVALAPHLTIDLQGEALAAVNSLSNERERAMLLATLAPTLPPNMLVASLAVAHTMREQDARVHALTVLAHYAPEHARGQTLLDALAAASNLPHHFERVTALVELVDVLPENMLNQAFTNALEATRLIENENARARALSLLGGNLPDSLLDRAVEAAYQIHDPQQQLNALIGLVPHLPKDKQGPVLERMLENVRQMPFEYKRARALVSLAPQLTPATIEAAIRVADALEEPFDRVTAYIALTQNMPPEKRPELIDKAWALIDTIDNGYDRSSALAAIAPFVPENRQETLAERAHRVIEEIEDEYDQGSAISILAPLLVHGKEVTTSPMLDSYAMLKTAVLTALDIQQQSARLFAVQETIALWNDLDPEKRFTLWKDVCTRLSQLALPDTLLILGALEPVFRGIGGDKSLRDIAHILGIR